MTDCEANLFMVDANNITTHVKLTLPAESVVRDLKQHLAAFSAAGFKPDPSKGARTYGGGSNWKKQAKPEDAPPEGVPPPPHCGERMIFKAAYRHEAKQKDIGARWECRKLKGCPQANEFGGFTLWDNEYQRQLERDGPQEPQERAQARSAIVGDPGPPASDPQNRAMFGSYRRLGEGAQFDIYNLLRERYPAAIVENDGEPHFGRLTMAQAGEVIAHLNQATNKAQRNGVTA